MLYLNSLDSTYTCQTRTLNVITSWICQRREKCVTGEWMWMGILGIDEMDKWSLYSSQIIMFNERISWEFNFIATIPTEVNNNLRLDDDIVFKTIMFERINKFISSQSTQKLSRSSRLNNCFEIVHSPANINLIFERNILLDDNHSIDMFLCSPVYSCQNISFFRITYSFANFCIVTDNSKTSCQTLWTIRIFFDIRFSINIWFRPC